MRLKILWKMEHLLQKSKYSIFHNIFKNMIFQSRQKASSWSKGFNTQFTFKYMEMWNLTLNLEFMFKSWIYV